MQQVTMIYAERHIAEFFYKLLLLYKTPWFAQLSAWVPAPVLGQNLWSVRKEIIVSALKNLFLRY
jgi:hypothetical protein